MYKFFGSEFNKKTGSLTLVIILLVGSIAGAFQYVNASNTGASASLSQCVNGMANPLSLQPCLNGTLSGTTYSDWVNGNANGQKAHWKEGQFIAYRTTISSISAGTHNIFFSYDTVHSGGHALDYLGSVNGTETFSVTSSASNYNNNNPCIDIVPSSSCSPSKPIGSTATPIENFGSGTGGEKSCGSSLGTFSGTQVPGKILLWGPIGSSITGATITSDNVLSGTGQCSTTVKVVFTVGGTGTANIVLAWGGHIASQVNWGFGDGASAVSGSPYHMALSSLDGASTGSQDRALATSAIFFTPSMSTAIFSGSTNKPLCSTNSQGTWSACTPTILVGTSVYDNATFALGSISSGASGTVTFQLRSGGTCSGPILATSSSSVSGGKVTSNSATFTPTTTGSYSFNATYSGDSQDFATTSSCEPFVVGVVSPGISTQVSSASITVGQSFSDKATMTGLVNPTGSGTITFKVYSPGDASCTGTVFDTKTVSSINANGDYQSGTFAASTQTGTYKVIANFSGDANNNKVSGNCNDANEVVTVGPASPAITTSVPQSRITFGQTSNDTATLSGGFSPTGSITFTVYYNDSACKAGSLVFTSSAVTVNGNGQYTSTPAFKPAKTGTYYWVAAYSGDSNNEAITAACGDSGETLNVQSIPKITAFGYTNTPTNNDPTTGNGTVVYTFIIHNYGSSSVTLSGSLVVSGAVTGTCTLPLTGTVAGGSDYTGTSSLTCSYSGNSGDTVTATLSPSYTDINGAPGAVSGSTATITFTIETT